jgi:hypothetical protein
MGYDTEEIKSFLAQRGETDLLKVLRFLEEEYEKFIDPDYEIVEDSSDCESECSTSDLVPEEIQINPSMNGFVSLA